MIVGGLATLLYKVLALLLVLLPTYQPPPGVGLAVLSAADFVLPLSELAAVMGAVVAYLTASLLYAGITRVVKFVRGAG